ncbi:hydrolase Nlp/P60 [Fulvitalea axinellae]|uniref:Hydrolase Nlp/P60 n=1 Tax=Fulvitalea axinellae TaxID=1182444 RepID=A0AAU9D7V9_9BACT|nr:hydrolase Nlp/P60 [Fulvitalea axinellae]
MFGICRLSVAPLRATAADSAEMVTQLLFGDMYEVLETSENGKWLRVKMEFDGYEGWLDLKQHTEISEPFFEVSRKQDFRICLGLTSTFETGKGALTLLAGAVSHYPVNPIFPDETGIAVPEDWKSFGEKLGVDAILAQAKRYMGAPYLWGGRTPFGIDCSGFTQVVFKIGGYSLLRDASMQVQQGEHVDFADRKPGDLAFFVNKEGRVTHVGICLPEGKIIHASGMVRIDTLTEKGIEMEDGTLSHVYGSLRRMKTLESA